MSLIVSSLSQKRPDVKLVIILYYVIDYILLILYTLYNFVNIYEYINYIVTEWQRSIGCGEKLRPRSLLAARKAFYRTVLRPRSVLMPRFQPVNISRRLMFWSTQTSARAMVLLGT